MLGWLRYRYKLSRAQSSRVKVANAYRKEIKQLREKGGPPDDIARLQGDEWNDRRIADDEIDALVTHRLISLAERHYVPLPLFDDERMWETGGITGSRHLTREGISQLRTSIRAEQAASSEHLMRWTTFVVGALGGLTGLIAIIKG